MCCDMLESFELVIQFYDEVSRVGSEEARCRSVQNNKIKFIRLKNNQTGG